MTKLQDEFSALESYFIKTINKWISDLNPILHDIRGNRHWMALPYHTLMINRWLGSSVEDAARMGAIFKLFMLSDYTHQLVQDDNEGQVYDELLQFNILIGDLLYGGALCLLCERNWDRLLPLLTTMIERVNEGHVIAYKDPQTDAIELATLEWGSFYRAAFAAAGEINNLTAEQVQRLDLIGLNLGLSIVAEDLKLGNDSIFTGRFREGIDRLATSLSPNRDARAEIWIPESGLKVPVAG